MKKTVIPFGPHHPMLLEPLHLQLVMEDEKIAEVMPALGYVHKGIEKLSETRDFKQNVFIAERICGNCSFMHALSYCMCIEDIMKLEVPPRAEFLRVIWAELNRVQSHMLCLGLLADSIGFESLYMQLLKEREKIMDIMEETAGSRVIISSNQIGGTRRDIDNEKLKEITKVLVSIEVELKKLFRVFLNDYTIKYRLSDIGIMTKVEAYSYGAVGPVARGSGIGQDMRMLGYGAYEEFDFEPVVETDGDCFARTVVRMKEIYQSIDLIRQAAENIPDGPVNIPVKGNPDADESIIRVEQPRGEMMYYVKTNGTKIIDRLRVQTPTFTNIPTLFKMLPGSRLSDIPVLLLTIDLCISCAER